MSSQPQRPKGFGIDRQGRSLPLSCVVVAVALAFVCIGEPSHAQDIPTVGEFRTIALPESTYSGPVVGEAIPLPSGAFRYRIEIVGENIIPDTIVHVGPGLSYDNAETWLLGASAGFHLEPGRTSSVGSSVSGTPTHYRAEADVMGAATFIVTGNFLAPINVDMETVTVGGSPWGVAVHPDMGRVYVVNFLGASPSVSVIDASTAQVVDTIALPSGNYQGIAVNPITNLVYVAGGLSTSRISVIDAGTNALIGSVDVNARGAIAVNPVTDLIYATGIATVVVIDGVTHGVLTTIDVGASPSSLAVNPMTNRIYVASGAGDPVTVIDGTTNSIIGSISTGDQSRAVAVNPSTNQIYVGNWLGHTVSVIDGATNSILSVVPVGLTPTALAVNSLNNRIYVTGSAAVNLNNSTGYVMTIDGNTHDVVSAIPVGELPSGIDVTRGSNKVYVSNSQNDTVSVFQDNFLVPQMFPNLGIEHSHMSNPIIVDSTLTTTVVVTNTGAGNAPRTIVTYSPWQAYQNTTDTTVVSAMPSQGSCEFAPPTDRGQRVRCNLGDLFAGQSAVITIKSTHRSAGTISSSAFVRSDAVDFDNANDTSSAETVVVDPVSFLREAIDVINTVDDSAFKNLNMRKTLTKKIIAGIAEIELETFADALEKLQNDVAGKMDGCATSGEPDRNDWILSCESQAQIFGIILTAIQLLSQLV